MKTKKKKGTKLYEWQCRGIGTCEKCKRENVKLTVDHIVPVAILRMLDNSENLILNDEENFAYLCSPCNSMKMDRIDITNIKTAPLMIKYMSPYITPPQGKDSN